MKDAGIAKPFENIYSIRSYHVGLYDELAHTMIKYSKQFFKTHKPIWTMVGVEKLGLKGMKVEIEATAVVE
jgi:enamine deaminase RidA (YjgF/YER057c/UK114 family)